MKDKFYNMSQRAKIMFLDDMEEGTNSIPMLICAKAIMRIARKLSDGDLVLAGK